MAKTFDICIRGAGVVGRTLALLLARERLRVALVAAPAPAVAPTGDVRAYALNATSRQLLESLRSWPDPAHATAVTQMQVFGDQGGAVHFDAATQGADALAWIVDVPALEARLAEAGATSRKWRWCQSQCPRPLPWCAKAGPAAPAASLGWTSR